MAAIILNEREVKSATLANLHDSNKDRPFTLATLLLYPGISPVFYEENVTTEHRVISREMFLLFLDKQDSQYKILRYTTQHTSEAATGVKLSKLLKWSKPVKTGTDISNTIKEEYLSHFHLEHTLHMAEFFGKSTIKKKLKYLHSILNGLPENDPSAKLGTKHKDILNIKQLYNKNTGEPYYKLVNFPICNNIVARRDMYGKMQQFDGVYTTQVKLFDDCKSICFDNINFMSQANLMLEQMPFYTKWTVDIKTMLSRFTN